MTNRTEHRAALPVGYGLHEYRITGVLGHGGFGITYSAHDAGLGKTVAIKEYLPGEFAVRDGAVDVAAKSGADADPFHWGLERFLDEARILARFHHPNVVGVHRYFEANGTAYMVMEFVDGDTLAQSFRKGMTFDAAALMALASPLLDGLEAVHRAGYLHRDIKPSNIMLRPDGRPVLLDFGSARSALGRGSRTVTSIVTPGYAPYEQYYNDGNQGPWTDIYALGAILHQIVAGAPPVEAPARVKNDPLVPAAQLGEGRYPAPMLAAIDWALAFDETARPQCVADWREALEGRAGAPRVTPLPPLAARAGDRIATGKAARPSRRRYVMAASIAGLLIASGTAYGVYEYRQLEIEQAREIAAREQLRLDAETAAEIQASALAREIEARQDAERLRRENEAAAERARLAEEQRKAEAAERAERERQAEIARRKQEAEDKARRAAEAETRRQEAAEAERRAVERARWEEAERQAREEQARRDARTRQPIPQGPVFGRTVTRDQLGRPRILTGPINPDAQPQPQNDMRWDDIDRDSERERIRDRRRWDRDSRIDLNSPAGFLSLVSAIVRGELGQVLAQQDGDQRLRTDPDAAAQRQRRAEQRAREQADRERLERALRERQQEQLRLLENERLRERR